MSAADRNPDASRLGVILTYFGSMSRAQAIYYLGKFWQRPNPSKIIEYITSKKYVCALHGDDQVISSTDSPLETFTPEKEKCIWVFFRYLYLYYFKNKDMQIVTRNSASGVDFILGDYDENGQVINKKFYSLCYVSSRDLTIRQMLIRTNRDDKLTYIFVCDSEEEAKKIVKINPDDKIWYVTDTPSLEIVRYKEEEN